jgi:hypothetical protein
LGYNKFASRGSPSWSFPRGEKAKLTFELCTGPLKWIPGFKHRLTGHTTFMIRPFLIFGINICYNSFLLVFFQNPRWAQRPILPPSTVPMVKPEERGSMFVRNVAIPLQYYTLLLPKTPKSEWLHFFGKLKAYKKYLQFMYKEILVRKT